ncbi:hypothetical protein BDZ94DRAFT_1234104 [Collybia nuda]|uniref:BTB domain-containing protein n=1 Tax=Collybia nuda TaxID=64659 RepID=A0A9P5YCG3_9AGAR|nr:hypothetical protein BDZ94DRAFT_1234104 [Collybia nuda]
MALNETTSPSSIASSPFNDIEADIILQSSDHVEFHVLKVFLSYASPFFKKMFTLPHAQDEQKVKDGKPVVQVTEESVTIELLLRYCYPRWEDENEAPHLETLISVLQASIKYDMAGVEKRVRAALISSRFTDDDPVRLYALTLRHGLEAETRVAAKETLRLPILGREYIPELELISAGAYHRLQEYHVKCAELASGVAKSLEWVMVENYVWFECTECRGNLGNVTISGNRRKWITSKWWLDYMNQAAAKLAAMPSGSSVMSPDLIDETLGRASLCSCCRGRAFREMRPFSERFAVEVDRVTAAVELEIIFPFS